MTSIDILLGRLKKHDKIFLAIKWGLIWGPLEGFWFLAPHFLTSHVLYPDSIFDWIFVLVFLLGAFAVIGVICAIFASFPLILLENLLRQVFVYPARAYGVAIGILLPLVYVALGYLFVWAKLQGIPPPQNELQRLDVLVALGIIISIALSQWLETRHLWFQSFSLERWLVACIMLGALFVPFRLFDSRPTKIVADSFRVNSAVFPATNLNAPLLFIGIDGAGWQSIGPLLKRGALPTLERLITNGRYGTTEGLWPPYLSGPAWAAILTGFPREQTGIYQDLMVSALGLKTPFQLPLILDKKLITLLLFEYNLLHLGVVEIKPQTRSMLHRTPIWELLAHSPRRVKTAVVRFWFTHPAYSKNKADPIIVSDWAGKDEWSSLYVNTITAERMVAPESLNNKLLAFFVDNAESARDPLSDFVDIRGYRQPLDAVQDPVEALRSSLRIDNSTLAASQYILQQNPDLNCLMVYLGGFDVVSHAFWQYRFPEQFHSMRPATNDVERLGPVIDRYLQFLDRELARLIGSFPKPPNVLIISDHGHEADQNPFVWRSKHSSQGIFIASGPDVSPAKDAMSISYYDVVPTILHLFKLESPKGLRGRSVLKDK